MAFSKKSKFFCTPELLILCLWPFHFVKLLKINSIHYPNNPYYPLFSCYKGLARVKLFPLGLVFREYLEGDYVKTCNKKCKVLQMLHSESVLCGFVTCMLTPAYYPVVEYSFI